LKVIFDMF